MEAGLPAAFLSIPHTGSRFSFRRSARADPRPQQGPDVNARCARWAAGPGAARYRPRSVRSSGALAPDTPAEGQLAPRTPWQAESWSAVAGFDGGERGALPWWGWKLCRPVLDERLPAPLGQPWWDGDRRSLARRALGGRWRDGASEVAGATGPLRSLARRGTGGRARSARWTAGGVLRAGAGGRFVRRGHSPPTPPPRGSLPLGLPGKPRAGQPSHASMAASGVPCPGGVGSCAGRF